jgi:hypothetical protein
MARLMGGGYFLSRVCVCLCACMLLVCPLCLWVRLHLCVFGPVCVYFSCVVGMEPYCSAFVVSPLCNY